jgi:histidinol-phosphate aminotransferase
MPCNFNLLPHTGIQTLAPYIPGKSADEVAREQGLTSIIKLASNENPLGCSQLVVKALAAVSSKQIATYPIAVHHPLRNKLASKLAVDIDMITLANGSDALFPLLQTIFALHCDKHILTHDCAFIAYGIYAKTLGIPVVSTPLLSNWQVDIDALITSCNEKTALIFLASPNNPTGVLVSQAEITRILQNIPSTTILVVDEAYYEYVNKADKLNTISLLATYPNLVITRTFSKAYGLAGLRLGYSITNSEIAAIIQRVLPPFAVNEIALVAASAALDDDEFIRISVDNNEQGLQKLEHGLTALGLNYLPSAGNFITFNCKTDTTLLYQKLQQHGIIVRPLHPYGLNNYLRVTVGSQQQNYRFLETLNKLAPIVASPT